MSEPILFEIEGELIEFTTDTLIDGYYDFLLQQYVANRIEGVIYFVDALLKEERQKLLQLVSIYETQEKYSIDSTVASGLHDLGLVCKTVISKLNAIIDHPTFEAELFKTAKSQVWADLQHTVN
jgi:hypothetical protein